MTQTITSMAPTQVEALRALCSAARARNMEPMAATVTRERLHAARIDGFCWHDESMWRMTAECRDDARARRVARPRPAD